MAHIRSCWNGTVGKRARNVCGAVVMSYPPKQPHPPINSVAPTTTCLRERRAPSGAAAHTWQAATEGERRERRLFTVVCGREGHAWPEIYG